MEPFLFLRSSLVDADEKLSRRLRKAASGLAIFGGTAGFLSVFEFVLKRLFGGAGSAVDFFKLWVGFGLLLWSVAWFLMGSEHEGSRRLGLWMALPVFFGPWVILSEVVGLVAAPDWLRALSTDPEGFAMAPEIVCGTATAFLLLTAALISGSRENLRGVAQLPAIFTLGLSVFGLIGFSYHEGLREGSAPPLDALMEASLVVALMSLIVLFGSARRGPMALVISRRLPGLVTRRLLPVIFLGPYLMGWLLLNERHWGFSVSGFDLSLFVVVLQILLALFVWLNSAILVNLERQKNEYELQRRRTSSELKQSEERFGTVFDQVAVGMAYSHWDGRLLRVNDRFCQLVGYSREELLLKTLPEITHPDDADADSAAARQILLGHESTYSVEKRYLRKDGSPVWILLTVSAVRDETGEPRYFFSIIQDIMERRAAEERLSKLHAELESRVEERTLRLSESVAALEREVLERRRVEERLERAMADLRSANEQLRNVMESTTDIVVAIDSDYRYIAFNEPCRKVLRKFVGREVNLGEDLFSIVPDLEGKNRWLLELWQKALNGEQGLFVQKLQCGSGETLTFEITISPLRNERGLIVGATQFMRDVSDRVRAADSLALAKTAAESANKAKSAFLANMSHEIRTPIGVVIGYAEMLARPEITEKERLLFAETILRNGNNLLNLINDILDLSKVEAGFLSFDRRKLPLGPFVGDFISQMRFRAAAASLSFKCSVRGAVPAEIETDEIRLRQILHNLVSNAIKFTPSGGVNVILDLVEDGGKKSLRFTVADTGIGIGSEAQKRLFKPFSQADPSISRKFGGTGLGLHLSKQLAEKLGGTVELVRSELGEGSVFSVTVDPGDVSSVPFVTESDLSREVREAPAKASPGTPSDERLKGLSILLVEDFEDNQELFRRMLQSAGAKVVVASDGRQAVERAAEEGFDLVLMDLQMPVVDGYEATRELRRRAFRKPIIALTAHAMKGELEKCLEAGCDDFMSKPIEKERLLETVHRTAFSNRF